MPTDQSADGEQQALPWLVFRRVGRLLDDVKRFEMLPEQVRRVGQPAFGKRVGGQQIAKLVMHSRHWHAYRRKRGSHEHRHHAAS